MRSAEWYLIAGAYVIAAFTLFVSIMSVRSGRPKCGICRGRMKMMPESKQKWFCRKCRISTVFMRVL